MIPISYLQTDTKWANKDYSAKGETTTIGKSGCGPTAAAMVIASLADSTVTPAVTAMMNFHNEMSYAYNAKIKTTCYITNELGVYIKKPETYEPALAIEVTV